MRRSFDAFAVIYPLSTLATVLSIVTMNIKSFLHEQIMPKMIKDLDKRLIIHGKNILGVSLIYR